MISVPPKRRDFLPQNLIREELTKMAQAEFKEKNRLSGSNLKCYECHESGHTNMKHIEERTQGNSGRPPKPVNMTWQGKSTTGEEKEQSD